MEEIRRRLSHIGHLEGDDLLGLCGGDTGLSKRVAQKLHQDYLVAVEWGPHGEPVFLKATPTAKGFLRGGPWPDQAAV